MRFRKQVVLWLTLLLPMLAFAQLSTHEQRLQYVQRLNAVRTSDPSYPLMLDSLITASQAANDVPLCMSGLARKMDYYYDHGDEQNMLTAWKNVLKFAEAQKDDYFYFFPWTRVLSFFINQRKLKQANDYLDKLLADAQRWNSTYGMVVYHENKAYSLSQLFRYQDAIYEYKKALTITDKHVGEPHMNSSYLCGLLANDYYQLKDYDQSKRYLQRGWKSAESLPQQMSAMMNLFQFYTDQKDTVEARSCLSWLQANYPRNRMLTITRRTYNRSLADFYIAINQIDSAQMVLQYVQTRQDSDEILCKLAVARQEWDKAITYQRSFHNYTDSMNVLKQARQLEDFRGQIDNSALELENKRLEQQNHQIELEQSHRQQEMMELEMAQRQIEMETMNQELNRVKKAQELQRLKQEDEVHKNNELRQERLQKERINRLIVYVILAVFLFFILIMCILLVSSFHISQQRKIAEAAAEDATRADRMKTMFLQNMNHEIRSPLSAIVQFSDMLNNPDVPLSSEERQTLTDSLHTNTDLLLTLLDDIIDLTSLQSGNYKLQYTEVPLSTLCRTAVAGMLNRVDPTRVQLVCDVPQQDTIIMSDQKRLLQVINNLLSNACKFTDDGSITLSYTPTQDGQFIQFSCTDTGSGIPADKAESIFNRFEKLGYVKKGFGLGLSICQSVTTLMGGRIWLDTSYQQGARFLFTLPNKQPETHTAS